MVNFAAIMWAPAAIMSALGAIMWALAAEREPGGGFG